MSQAHLIKLFHSHKCVYYISCLIPIQVTQVQLLDRSDLISKWQFSEVNWNRDRCGADWDLFGFKIWYLITPKLRGTNYFIVYYQHIQNFFLRYQVTGRTSRTRICKRHTNLPIMVAVPYRGLNRKDHIRGTDNPLVILKHKVVSYLW